MVRSKRRLVTFALAICVALTCASVAHSLSNRFPVVTVASDGSGDFGPQTPGTTTSGIQEAINYCKANQVAASHDLYIKGGATYTISRTIYIPPSQNFRIDGGVYTLNWTGSASSPVLSIDSGLDCHYSFGVLRYGGSSEALLISPSGIGPDNTANLTNCELSVMSIESTSSKGAGVRLNGVAGGIRAADFHFGNIQGFATGILFDGSPAMVCNNRITCMDLHTNVSNATLVQAQAPINNNRLKFQTSLDGSPSNVKGVDISGYGNDIELLTKGGLSLGNDVIFENLAGCTKVHIMAGSSVDPTTLVTDLSPAQGPWENQITWTGAPASIRTLTPSTGTYTYFQTLYPATARIVGGAVTDIRLIRTPGDNMSSTIDYGNTTPVDILLSAGDRLQIDNTSAPTVYIIPRANG